MLFEVFSDSALVVLCASVVVFFFGAAIGSFMEVVRVRCSWRSVLSGRSRCAHCKRTLTWRELIPLFSYLVQRGKCSECSCSIPRYHLASEVLTGVLFVGAFLFSDSLMQAGIICISALFLPALVLSDSERMEVPEHLSLPFAYLTLGVATTHLLYTGSVTPVLGGVVLAAPFFLLWLSSGGRAMGLGDAKVALSLGFLLPSLLSALSVFLLTFWIGVAGLTLYALSQLLRRQRVQIRRSMRVPLIPSMALAFYVVLFTDFSYLTLLGGLG